MLRAYLPTGDNLLSSLTNVKSGMERAYAFLRCMVTGQPCKASMKSISLSHNNFSYYSTIFIVIVCLIASCKNKDQWKQQSDGISLQVTNWNSRYESLNTRVDSLWDATSEILAKGIPEDFPATDRDIFIHARNAGHIRMFMSFKQLDPSLQSVVNEAGEMDNLLATEMRQLQQERHVLEEEIASFLSQISQDDPSLAKRYQSVLPQLAVLATN